MKESKAYLLFFKKNIVFLLAPLVLSLLIGFWYNTTLPITYQINRWYTVAGLEDPPKQIPIADHIVTLLRSEQLKKDLKVTSEITVYKPSPLSFMVSISSAKQGDTKNDLEKLDQFVGSRYQLEKQLNDDLKEQKPPLLLPLLLFSASGLGVGLLIALVKTYVEQY